MTAPTLDALTRRLRVTFACTAVTSAEAIDVPLAPLPELIVTDIPSIVSVYWVLLTGFVIVSVIVNGTRIAVPTAYAWDEAQPCNARTSEARKRTTGLLAPDVPAPTQA